MMDAPYEKEFVFQDGRRAKNVRELLSIIKSLSVWDFERFVNTSKNDFANWTEYVLLDKELSNSLRTTLSLDKTKELLEARINHLEGKQLLESDASPKKLFQKSFSIGIFKTSNAKSNVLNDTSENIIVKKTEDKTAPKTEHIATHNAETVDIQNTPVNNHAQVSEKKKWYHFGKKVHDTGHGLINETHHETHHSGAIHHEEHHVIHNTDHGEHHGTNAGNIVWIIIYGLLILLIIALIVYKFVFNN
ncbi:MAG: hypothetical protein ACP5NV_00930 [Candidatus Woesearchaeota archaeon]